MSNIQFYCTSSTTDCTDTSIPQCTRIWSTPSTYILSLVLGTGLRYFSLAFTVDFATSLSLLYLRADILPIFLSRKYILLNFSNVSEDKILHSYFLLIRPSKSISYLNSIHFATMIIAYLSKSVIQVNKPNNTWQLGLEIRPFNTFTPYLYDTTWGKG